MFQATPLIVTDQKNHRRSWGILRLLRSSSIMTT